ncbi:MAG: HNH endonuclease [Fimbriimonadaceae bacterium]|nr:HNH endonuclease [Fimbriimonadaceae bacterium]
MNSILDELGRRAVVWQKGAVIPGYDSAMWRHDAFGRVMRWSDYGNRNSEYGWEIDHIVSTAVGGGDHIGNLRPLNCILNASRGGTLAALLAKKTG